MRRKVGQNKNKAAARRKVAAALAAKPTKSTGKGKKSSGS
jgi:hypothetical protein